MDIWNTKDLEPPPVSSCKVTSKEIDIRLLDAVLKDGTEFFENQQHLYTEAALLSRIVYRLKMKFRSSKDFKAVEKLNRVLRAYLQMQISKSLKILLKSIPQNYRANKTYMLTKNMLDYVLVRLQGLGKTLSRVLEICKIISVLMQQRVRLGHFWKIAIIIYAITARIFVITKTVLKYTNDLYLNLLPFSSTLGNSGIQWLPEEYIFPNRLDEWLGIDWLDLEQTVIEIVDEETDLSYFRLIDESDDDVEFCDEYVIINDEPSVCEDLTHSKPNVRISGPQFDDCEISDTNFTDKPIDVGEIINISDSETPKQLKRKRSESKSPKQLRKKRSFNKQREIDIGELITLSGGKIPKPKRKSLKGRKFKINNSIIPISNSTSKDVRKKQKSVNKQRRKRNKKKSSKTI